MSSSDLSSLSSLPPSDDEAVEKSINRAVGLERYFKVQPAKEPSPDAPAPREKSPPHEYVLADNEIIAFTVMFRSRFSNAFPKSLPHYGPQDIEKGVSEPIPSEQVEKLLCALLSLVLNRKKDVERGHYSRALEEAIAAHSAQWPKTWEGKNPLHGGRSFLTMSPIERLVLLRTLILWSLSSSETIQAMLKESYKQSRHDDDLNQPLSVQPWGRDAYKRRYWLIEGQDDTHFRVYRESNPALKHNTWWNIAGNIDEVKEVAEGLDKDPSQHAKRLREQIKNAIPRFEASDEKRKRRDYRLARKAQFTRPELGFSLYEGRTRGKKLKYTFSDDEDDDDTSDAISTRRSTRQSGISTPAEPSGPTFTASGRQVKARQGGAYGESMLSGQRGKTGSSPTDAGPSAIAAGSDVDSEDPISTGRPQRSTRAARTNGWRKGDDHIEDYNSVDEMDEEEDAASSGDNWDGDDDGNQNFAGEEEEEEADDEDEEMSQSEEEPDKHLVVQLRYRKGQSRSATASRKNSGQGGITLQAPQSKIQPAVPTTMETTARVPAETPSANSGPIHTYSNTPVVSHAHPEPSSPPPPMFKQSLNSHPVNEHQAPNPNFSHPHNQAHSPTLPIHPPQIQSPSYPHHPNGISQSG